jgi:ATP-binding cassette subfamily F protein 3
VLEFSGISKHFGPVSLLDNVSFRVGDQDRVGLVGSNGSGKTTIFRIIAGEESPDEGSIQRKKGLTVGLLPQELDVRKEGTVLDEVLAARPEYLEAYRELKWHGGEWGEGGAAQRRLELEHRLEALGGETFLSRAKEILSGLGFAAEEFQRPLATMSGGWNMRVRLAQLLLREPELLLLDEPTNHLDLPSIVWFEGYLKGFGGSFVIVSHDREFLNRTVDRIMEVDRGVLGQFSGNYDYYRKRKQEEIEHKAKAARLQQVRVREMEDFIARNRVRKDRAKQVQSRLKQLDKMEMIEAPTVQGEIRFQFAQPERSGSHVLKFEGVTKSYDGKRVFSGLDLSVVREEKVAVIGVNGMGKSTILKIAAGAIPYDSGTVLPGHQVTVAYYAQHQLEALTPSRTVLEEILSIARGESLSQVRSLLGAFLFSGQDVDKKVAVLSGGEKSRLALAKLLMRPANFIIMDEPTNHLDIASREVLEEALRQFTGTLLVASHDRRFIDNVCNRVVELDRGVLTSFPGNYSDYAWKRAQEAAARAESGETGLAGRRLSTPRPGDRLETAEQDRTARDERKERKRQEALLRNELYRRVKPLREAVEKSEKAVTSLEQKIAALETELADPSIYSVHPERARDRAMQLAQLRRDLSDEMEVWEKAVVEAEQAELEVRNTFGSQEFA